MELIHGKRFDQFGQDLDMETTSRESQRTSWWWEEEEGQRGDTDLLEEDSLRRIPL